MTNDVNHDALAKAGAKGPKAFNQKLDELVEIEKKKLQQKGRQQIHIDLAAMKRKKPKSHALRMAVIQGIYAPTVRK